jgi:spermidine/putrescine-binding protein
MRSGKPIGRRRFGLLLGGTASVAALAAPTVLRASSSDPITFFSYATYSDPQLTGAFAKSTGTPLRIQNFGDIDQMVGKLKATGGDGLDVVSVPNQLIQSLLRDGILEPIDVSRLANWAALYPEFRDAEFVRAPQSGQVAAVPTVWGPEGLIYRTDKITSADSWSALWDPNYKGRIAGLDYGYEMVLIAAQALGMTDKLRHDPIAFTDVEFQAIKAKLLEQKKLVDKYWGSSAEGGTLIANGEVWITIGRLAMLKPLREENVPVRLAAPREGAQGWCTSTCMLKASRNKDAAYDFLNYVTGDIYQNGLMTVKGYPGANKTLMDAQPDTTRNTLMMNDPHLLTSLVWWQNAADLSRINAIWNEVKAS